METNPYGQKNNYICFRNIKKHSWAVIKWLTYDKEIKRVECIVENTLKFTSA